MADHSLVTYFADHVASGAPYAAEVVETVRLLAAGGITIAATVA